MILKLLPVFAKVISEYKKVIGNMNMSNFAMMKVGVNRFQS